jgi:hypothetical protein
MKKFNESDDLSSLTVGDLLVLSNGDIHEAVHDEERACTDVCSILDHCLCLRVGCDVCEFHFKLLKQQ